MSVLSDLNQNKCASCKAPTALIDMQFIYIRAHGAHGQVEAAAKICASCYAALQAALTAKGIWNIMKQEAYDIPTRND